MIRAAFAAKAGKALFKGMTMVLDEKIHEEITAVKLPPPCTKSAPASVPLLLVKLTLDTFIDDTVPCVGKTALTDVLLQLEKDMLAMLKLVLADPDDGTNMTAVDVPWLQMRLTPSP